MKLSPFVESNSNEKLQKVNKVVQNNQLKRVKFKNLIQFNEKLTTEEAMNICREAILQNQAVGFMIQQGLFSPESSIEMCSRDLVVRVLKVLESNRILIKFSFERRTTVVKKKSISMCNT